jgi:hypothetical protein
MYRCRVAYWQSQPESANDTGRQAMSDRDTPTTYELKPGDAGLATEILLRLADLFDGGSDQLTQQNRLSEVQMQLMSKPVTHYSQDPEQTAKRLRAVSAAIEGQFPPHAGIIRH